MKHALGPFLQHDPLVVNGVFGAMVMCNIGGRGENMGYMSVHCSVHNAIQRYIHNIYAVSMIFV